MKRPKARPRSLARDARILQRKQDAELVADVIASGDSSRFIAPHVGDAVQREVARGAVRPGDDRWEALSKLVDVWWLTGRVPGAKQPARELPALAAVRVQFADARRRYAALRARVACNALATVRDERLAFPTVVRRGTRREVRPRATPRRRATATRAGPDDDPAPADPVGPRLVVGGAA